LELRHGRSQQHSCWGLRHLSTLLQVRKSSRYVPDSTNDAILRSGQLLYETCATLKGAATELDERALCVRSHWKRTSIQLDFINRIWESLDKEHQDIQNQILQVLTGKLNSATSKLDKLIKKSSDHRSTEVNRVKYALVKKGFDEIIEDLESWQKMFDPSWFLILKVSHPLVDQQMNTPSLGPLVPDLGSIRDLLKEEPLRKVSIFLPDEGLERSTQRAIPYTSANYAQRTRSDKWVIIDPMFSNADIDLKLMTKDVRDLATRLSCADASTFAILQCRGVVRTSTSDNNKSIRFDFVFQMPKAIISEPSSLRACLVSRLDHTLSDRFKLAKQVATAVSYVHTLGFVHKNIRPETLVTFEGPKSVIESCFLIGFEKFRNADGRTLKVGDAAWEHNLYRHPQRQGVQPEEIYSMQHDIYSLGVCLLEIGLWDSFVSHESAENDPIPGTALDITLDVAEFSRPGLMKEHLVALAKSELPREMGERYEEVVVNCLTCLDRDNVDFGDQGEFEDADGVVVGARYIEKVCILVPVCD
jgi:hypothetical protein